MNYVFWIMTAINLLLMLLPIRFWATFTLDPRTLALGIKGKFIIGFTLNLDLAKSKGKKRFIKVSHKTFATIFRIINATNMKLIMTLSNRNLLHSMQIASVINAASTNLQEILLRKYGIKFIKIITINPTENSRISGKVEFKLNFFKVYIILILILKDSIINKIKQNKKVKNYEKKQSNRPSY